MAAAFVIGAFLLLCVASASKADIARARAHSPRWLTVASFVSAAFLIILLADAFYFSRR